MRKWRFHLPSARDIFGDNLEQIIPRLLLLIITFLYTGYFTYLKIEYWNLMLCSTDYAVIDSATHSTALGDFMWSPEAHFNYWKQHIAPILLFFSFFYLFSDNYWFVFVVETLTIGLAAIPLFLIATRFLRDERLALLVVAAYFSSGTLQVANLFDYHMESHEALFIFSAFYGHAQKEMGMELFLYCPVNDLQGRRFYHSLPDWALRRSSGKRIQKSRLFMDILRNLRSAGFQGGVSIFQAR
jgi:uncharacterized membrane protein